VRALLVIAIACGGCYKPSFTDCDISCANGTCPRGLHCNAEQKCVSDLGTSCGSSSMDGSMGPDAMNCGDLPFPVSNVTCPLTLTTMDWTIGGNGASVQSTGTPMFPAGVSAQVINNGTAVLVVVRDLIIQPNATLNVIANPQDPLQQALPLIIVASGTASIEGNIVVQPAQWTSSAGMLALCGAGNGGIGTCGNMPGAGGGGGAFGPVAVAGAGGSCVGGSGGLAGMPNGDGSLAPLRGGCPGGSGTPAPGQPSTTAGFGGAGGMALQLSATMLVVAGHIDAGGAGGRRGQYTGGGGGGGGAGGGILLESAAGQLKSTAVVCANGGGGASSTEDGQRGSCAETAAQGGTGNSIGGLGAYGATPASAGAVGGAVEGGGGGGGGVGRIRLNGPFTRDPAAVITPPAS
jgi:hypothetical protein